MSSNPIDISRTDSSKAETGIKLLALMLMVGGAVGVALAAFLVHNMPYAGGFLGLIFVLIFGWSALKGLDLWKGKPAGYKWARILFAAQIPIIQTSALSYSFYTGLNLSLMLRTGDASNSGMTQLGMFFNLGSAFYCYIGATQPTTALGVNVIAIAALIYLFTVSPPGDQKSISEEINPA